MDVARGTRAKVLEERVGHQMHLTGVVDVATSVERIRITELEYLPTELQSGAWRQQPELLEVVAGGAESVQALRAGDREQRLDADRMAARLSAR